VTRSNEDDYVLKVASANTLRDLIFKILNTHKKASGVAHVVQYLHSKQKGQSSNPRTSKKKKKDFPHCFPTTIILHFVCFEEAQECVKA
jgi:hypothetical protein